jgi:hypothetical protein
VRIVSANQQRYRLLCPGWLETIQKLGPKMLVGKGHTCEARQRLKKPQVRRSLRGTAALAAVQALQRGRRLGRRQTRRRRCQQISQW